ncbi:MAG: FAD-binding oxidoreductase [Proteobacteria bacterium]|nr:FAD-binding oxidoreductase [Pseudomonadota bacterium]
MRKLPLAGLRKALTDSELLDDPEELAAYGGDESTAAEVVPKAVVQAANVADISATMEWATKHGVLVTPRGAGTGKAGGCVPCKGGIVLSLAPMQRVKAVRPEHGWAEVEPGVITGPFRELMAEGHGLFYPPDPASLDECTLGGNVATNAGGPVATKYGVTGDHVLGVTAVLPDGTVIETGRRQPKGVAGYDLTSLLVGSEGTLAVIAGIRLALRPRPREVVSAMIAFERTSYAAEAVIQARTSGLQPRALELFDSTTVERMGRDVQSGVDPTWGALLLVEFDGEPGMPAAFLRRFAEELPRPPEHLQLCSTPAQRKTLWSMRRRTSRSVKEGALGWITEDVAVPLGAMPRMLQLISQVGRKHKLIAFAYGHAGDGNLHVNLLWEELSGSSRAAKAADEIMVHALELGGTVTGEHGIGLVKRPYLERELGAPQVALQRQIKATFDPLGILNPGKGFPTSEPA